MMNKPLRAFAASVAATVTLLAFSPAFSYASATSTEDALARLEFAEELSLDIKNAPAVMVFRMLSRETSVPFVLDFEEDPDLRVTFRAQNMVARGILASVASTYGLEFASEPEGIVVTRPGFPSAAKRTIVGAWPVVPGEQYDFFLVIRDPAGQLVSSPRIGIRQGTVGRLKQGINGREVGLFDRDRNIIEPTWVGGVEVAISVTADTPAGLDLIVEVIVSRALSAESYAEEHKVSRRRITARDTVLAKWPDGYEFVLARWERR